MLVNKLVAQGRGLAAALVKRGARIELGWKERQMARFEARDSTGRELAIRLEPGTVLRGGDVLVAEDGSLIGVKAASQPVLVVRPCPEHGTASDLLRAAYHLGGRHAAVQLDAQRLLIEPDAGLRHWLEGMHLVVTEDELPFEPEGDASACAHHHGHAHHDGHHHGHHRRQDHGHAPHHHAHDHDHDHEHDHEHGRGHDRHHR